MVCCVEASGKRFGSVGFREKLSRGFVVDFSAHAEFEEVIHEGIGNFAINAGVMVAFFHCVFFNDGDCVVILLV